MKTVSTKPGVVHKDIFACTGAYPGSETQEYYAPLPADQEAAVQEEAERYGD